MTHKEYMRRYNWPAKLDQLNARTRRLRDEALELGFREEAETLARMIEVMGEPRPLEKRLAAPLWG